MCPLLISSVPFATAIATTPSLIAMLFGSPYVETSIVCTCVGLCGSAREIMSTEESTAFT